MTGPGADDPRIFTIEQANRMLPLVRRIVEDIVLDYARWREKIDLLEVIAAGRRSGAPPDEAEKTQGDAQQLASEIDRYAGELAELGVELKDFALGLIDFPSVVDGRPVYLCWRLGEESVDYWHDLDSGYAARQPLSQVTPS